MKKFIDQKTSKAFPKLAVKKIEHSLSFPNYHASLNFWVSAEQVQETVKAILKKQ